MSLLGQFVLELSFFWPWKTIHHQTFKNFYRRPHKYQLHTTILKVKHKIYNNWNSIINVHQIAFVFKTVFCRIFYLVTSSADFQFSTNLRQLKIVQNIVLKLNALHYVSQYVRGHFYTTLGCFEDFLNHPHIYVRTFSLGKIAIFWTTHPPLCPYII